MGRFSAPQRPALEILGRPEGGPGGTGRAVVPPGGVARARRDVVATLHQLIDTLTTLGDKLRQDEAADVGRALPLLLNAVEAGRLLSISRTKVLEMAARGQLPSIRIGGSVRIPRDRLVTWIADNSVGPTLAPSWRPNWASARADD